MSEFFSNPFVKGQYEYLSARKRQQLRFALCCAFLVLCFFISGLLIYKSQKNLLVVPAALMVLPMANFSVTYLALGKGQPLSEDKRREVATFEELGLGLYHLVYVDEKGKRHFLAHCVTYQNAIVAYGPTVKEEERVPLESDCILRLKAKNVNLRLKIYRDWKEYMTRLSEIPEALPEDQRPVVERIQEIMLGMCL